jgi:hypothetical protein
VRLRDDGDSANGNRLSVRGFRLPAIRLFSLLPLLKRYDNRRTASTPKYYFVSFAAV